MPTEFICPDCRKTLDPKTTPSHMGYVESRMLVRTGGQNDFGLPEYKATHLKSKNPIRLITCPNCGREPSSVKKITTR